LRIPLKGIERNRSAIEEKGSAWFPHAKQLVRNSLALDLRFLLDCGEETDCIGFYVDGRKAGGKKGRLAQTL